MRTGAVAIGLIVAIAGSACGAGDPGDVSPTAANVAASTSPRAAETAPPMPVPGAFYGAASGGAGRMVEGTRCWADGCVDMIGPVTLPDPAAITAGEAIDVLLEGIEPDDVSFAWVNVDGVDPHVASDGTVAWPVGVGDYAPRDDLVAPAETGDYVLTLFARWDGAGDVVFSTFFRVR